MTATGPIKLRRAITSTNVGDQDHYPARVNIIRTLVLAASLTFTLCVAGQVRLGEPQLSAKPADFPTYPLKASANGRYLVDQNETPTLLVGDSPHSLFVNLSPQQVDAYFANRASHGINAVWVEVLCNT